MSEKVIVWDFVNDFLTSQLLYVSESIKNSYPNNVPITTLSNFVVITKLNSIEQQLSIPEFDIVLQKLKYSAQINTDYQLDFYGENSQESSAKMFTYLNSLIASNILKVNNYGIGRVDNAQNLTNNLDRDNYVQRHVLKFTLLRISEVIINQDGISLADIPINFKQI